MTVVKLNAMTISEELRDELVERFPSFNWDERVDRTRVLFATKTEHDVEMQIAVFLNASLKRDDITYTVWLSSTHQTHRLRGKATHEDAWEAFDGAIADFGKKYSSISRAHSNMLGSLYNG